MGCPASLDIFQADKPPDAVFDMDNQITGRQSRHFRNNVLGAALAAGAAHQTIAQNILLAHHQNVIGDKAAFQAPHGHADIVLFQSQGFGKTGDRFDGFHTVIG